MSRQWVICILLSLSGSFTVLARAANAESAAGVEALHHWGWHGQNRLSCHSLPNILAQLANQPTSLADQPISLPSGGALWRALTLRDYNTRVVVLGTTLLGIAAGVIGTFAYLRKRAMLGDALSHATLPGIALAFILMQQKHLAGLLLGATITGALGVAAVIGMRKVPRIKEDAAIGIVLSVFFGVGMVLLSLIQQMNTGQEAGLQAFIYGQAAAMLSRDAVLIGIATVVVLGGCALFFKEFRLVCFDQGYAAAHGRPVWLIDFIMMGLVVLTTIVALQAVGLILVVALLIIPAAAARFWTDRLLVMVAIAAVLGAISGWLGSTISAQSPRLPTGAIIVLCVGVLFFLSMFFSPHRGLVANTVRRWSLRRRVRRQHLLRALAEFEEILGGGAGASRAWLLSRRTWSERGLEHLVAGARRRGLVSETADGVLLTESGRREARRVLRNHRLWEMYLIKYADIAPSHVDRDADEIEHVLPEQLVRELEAATLKRPIIPPSPHAEEGQP
jgi:manganese/zinc/iron transport system permease protein